MKFNLYILVYSIVAGRYTITTNTTYYVIICEVLNTGVP